MFQIQTKRSRTVSNPFSLFTGFVQIFKVTKQNSEYHVIASLVHCLSSLFVMWVITHDPLR